MVVTWTRVTNPPAAGNITLADHTKVDGSEGEVFKPDNGTLTLSNYGIEILEDSTFVMLNTTTFSIRSKIIMRAGSKWLFNGTDDTYNLFACGVVEEACFFCYGTSLKHVTIGGYDAAHRPQKIIYPNGPIITWEYLDIQNKMLNQYIYANTFNVFMSAVIKNCTWPANHTVYTFILNYGYATFENCTFSTNAYTYNMDVRSSFIYFKNCSFDSTLVHIITRSSLIVFEDCTYTVAQTFIIYKGSGYTGTTVLFATKNTIVETNGEPIYVQYRHNKLGSYIFDADDQWGRMFALNNTTLSKFLEGGVYSSTGTAYFYTLRQVEHYYNYLNYSGRVDTFENISVSGAADDNNDEYTVVISSPALRTQSIEQWSGDSDNVTLVPETTFTDIMDALDAGLMKPRPGARKS